MQATNMRAGKRRTYETLNGMRGAAAMLVTLFHLGIYWPDRAAVHRDIHAILVPGGYLAVDIFFVLSGFVLANAYGERIRSGELGSREFAILRMIRFYPLYLVGLLLGLFKGLVQIALHTEHAFDALGLAVSFVFGVLFLPAYYPGLNTITILNAASWSIFFEFLVNIMWIATYFRLRRRGWRLIVLISGPLLALCIWRFGSVHFGMHWSDVGAGVLRTMFSFGFGLLLFELSGKMPQRSNAIAAIALLAVMAVTLSFNPPPWVRPFYDIVVVLVVSPCLVGAGTLLEPGPRLARLFAMLGAISYPIYIVHWPLIGIVGNAMHILHVPATAGLVAFLAGLIVTAYGLDKADIVVRGRLTRRFSTMRASGDVVAAEPAAP